MNQPIPPYLAKLLEQVAAKPLSPRLHHVHVAHDDWCDLLAGRGPCNCDPDVTIVPHLDPKRN